MYTMAKRSSSSKIQVTILGCGTSTGVPLIHCKCKVCRSKNPKNNRLRASIWVQSQGKSILIDVSPDFRQQALRAKIPRIDAILFTHPHADHTAGIDEIRSFNFIQNEVIPSFGHGWTITELKKRYRYIFTPGKIEGGGVARLSLNSFSLKDQEFKVKGISVIPLELDHGSQKVAGFRIGNFAYLTDCHAIPEKTFERLHKLDVLILDCLRMAKHGTHLNYEQALFYAEKIAAKKTIFTHMGHDFDYVSFSKKLLQSHVLAYDGMIIKIKE